MFEINLSLYQILKLGKGFCFIIIKQIGGITMNKIINVILLSILLIFTSNAYDRYLNKKVQEIIKKSTVKIGDFSITPIPVPYKITIINTYRYYKSLGLDEKEIIQRLKMEFIKGKRSGFPFIIIFNYEGKRKYTGIRIPSDLRDYVFLENRQGVKGRIKLQNIPLKRSLNANNRSVTVRILFSTVDTKGRFLLDTDRLILHIRDIIPGIKDLRIRYKYPCDIDFSDAPEDVKYILREVTGHPY